MSRFSILTALSIVLAACTTHDTMNGGTMGDELAEAEQELDRHHGAMMAARSLPSVDEEADVHSSNMGEVMARMTEAMGGMMSHCSGARMGEMHELMTALRYQMRDHAEALENATQLDSVQTLCASHVGEVRGILSSMHDGLGRAECGMMR